MKNLVIVESPSKSKTIEKYLGDGYTVVASMGHIRDLATSGKYGLGVDVEGNFEPKYVTMKGKGTVVSGLKKLVKNSDKVYLATDPDREGEAISWHLKETLKLDDNYTRVTFNEITKDVILDAFKHTRDIDINLVKSQETRRILDRIIGFRLSKLMQSKTNGKSAGRVQSVALKLVVDREEEINKFVPVEYWTIQTNFKEFTADLIKYKDAKIEIPTEEVADQIISELSNKYEVANIISKVKSRKGVMPFKTSTLQQTAINRLNFPSSKTMKIAQKLYEGIDIGSETTGLITYMRTDSERLSSQFINETFKYIKEEYGDNYVGAVKKQKKNENMQDAHEAIRVTSPYRTPASIKKYLSSDEYKLYSLIYARSLATLMSDAKVEATAIDLLNNDYLFRVNGSKLVFDGYLKVYGNYEDSEDVILPDIKGVKVLESDDVVKEQHFTKPLPRYTESSLIKELESLGIGRPSTYATIMETIKSRNYVNVVDKKFVPTEVGIDISSKLQEGFSDIINVKYTANMEHDLDLIAEDKLDNVKVLKDFYNKFEPMVQDAFKNMEKKEAKQTGENCPECGSPLVIRNGRYGEFVACSNYPTCKYIKKEEKEEKVICKCPNCDGDIVEKKSRRGKVFYGCNKYPKCKTAYWYKPIDKKCPECGEMLLDKNGKIVCSSCEYTEEN